MIRTRDLSFRYPDQPVQTLVNLNFAIAPGETVLVSGPTGCGKSTLGFCLCGTIPHLMAGTLSGEVRVNRKPVFQQAVRETAEDLGFLIQHVAHQMFTEQVSEEIAFGLENFCIPEEQMEHRITQALELVGASPLRSRRLSTLSAGEQQRVMLAAMLALEQKILILDEPLAYLDRAAQAQFMELVSNLSRKGRTIVLFEHRRDVVHQVPHRELFLENGILARSFPARTRFHRITNLPPKTPELVFDRVCFSRPQAAPLFRDLSFEVRQHQSVVLLGPNGSGKTTLMALAMGLIKGDQGSITTCGYNPKNTSPATLAQQAAFIFQHPDHQLYLTTVQDEIAAQAADRDAARSEMAAMGLAGLENRHPRSLSTGQKRRVTLAAALARRPRLMLLDEPSVGQDDHSLSLVIKRLDDYLIDGGAVLTATHDDRVARALAHEIIDLNPGGSHLLMD